MKIKLTLILSALILISVPFNVFADGFVVEPLPEGDWKWTEQDKQQAFINYEDGKEKLIVSVNMQRSKSEAVWVVPVPAKSAEIETDITSSTPAFFGDDIVSKAKSTISDASWTSYKLGAAGQIWPLPFLAVETLSLGEAREGDGAQQQVGDLISIESHIEKKGMVSEVITAKDSQALYNYLKEQGLDIEPGAIPAIESYINKDYSFVVSWMSSRKNFGGETRGIYISFPTQEIYYPLLLTSVYGDQEIPITIRVLDHVKPKVFSEIKPYTKVDYFTKITRTRGGAHQARCVAEIGQLGGIMELYISEHGRYPSSLQDLKEYREETRSLLNDIKEECNSSPLYRSSGKENYTMRFRLWDGIFEINSDGFTDFIKESEGEQLIYEDLKKFYGDEKPWKGEAEYTKISISAPAKSFKKDLWMRKGKPALVSAALSITNNPKIASGVIYFLSVAFISFLTAGILGWVCFRKFKKYALLGLTNVFTLIAFYFALRNAGVESPKKCSRRKFLFLFSGLFLVLLFVLLASLPA